MKIRYFFFALAFVFASGVANAQDPDSTLRVVDITSPIASSDTLGGAVFGPLPPEGGLPGTFVTALDGEGNPSLGCSDSEIGNAGDIAGNIVLISRGVCSFTTKADIAFNAGAIGYIVYQDDRVPDTDSTLVLMGGDCGVPETPNACELPGAFAPRYWWISLVEPNQPGVEGVMRRALLVAIEAGPNGVPGTHNLTSAYPNPFNPSTQFQLEVAEQQNVRIEVYNSLGQRVAVLHDGSLAPGVEHSFTFAADGLPSGVYLYRATGEQFVQSRQVTLLK